MRFRVVPTDEAREDLIRLTDALLERAQTTPDLDRACMAIQAVQDAVEALSDSALRCRKTGDGHDPFLRELVIPFGSSGYLALFEIVGDTVVVAAIRHQLEDDYH